MEKKRLEWKVGLFVFIALVVLGGLLLQFSKGPSIFRPTYNLYLVAENVGGLKKSASVLMSGVQVGTVSDIQLNPQGTNVTITLKIYEKYLIHRDARFLIETSGFLGDQFVAIVPTANEGGTWQPEEHATAEPPINIQEVARSAAGFLQHIDDTTKGLDEAIADVRRLLLNQETLTNLASAVGSLRMTAEHAVSTVDNLDGLVESNRAEVGTAISNVVAFSEQLKLLGTNAQDLLATNGAELATSMKNIESSTVILQNLLSDAQSGKGLAGTLFVNEQLATNVDAIAANFAITTSNLNRLGLWRFLWHHEETPTTTRPRSSPHK